MPHSLPYLTRKCHCFLQGFNVLCCFGGISNIWYGNNHAIGLGRNSSEDLAFTE